MGKIVYMCHTTVTAFDGQLGGCSVCGTWEGEMPTDCPGYKLSELERELVLSDRLDYRRKSGGWTDLGKNEYMRRKRLYS